MKPAPLQIAAFLLAAAATAGLWVAAWPRPAVQPQMPAALPVEDTEPAPRWTNTELDSRVAALRAAADDTARLEAAARLAEIPVAEIPFLLERIRLIENRRLTLEAKLLLIAWAAADGEAAADWAWQRLRREGPWDLAFREIAASWAWCRPAGLCEWAKRRAGEHRPELGSITVREAERSEQPILDFDALSQICRCLVTVAPREAMEVLLVRGGFSSEDSRLFDSLQTVSQVREALLAFDCVEQLRPDRSQGDEIFAMSLMHRWKDLDPGDFAASPHGHLIPDPRQTPPQLPVPDGPRGWLAEFDAWRKANPGSPPDMAGWPPAKQEAWQDLEAIRMEPDR